MKITKTISIIIVVLLFVISCSTTKTPKIEISTKIEKKPCKIAILPFKNQTEDPTISDLFYRLLLESLIESAKFDVIPEGQIRRILILERHTPNKEISRNLINTIRKKTGAEALIVGEVLESKRKEKQLKLSVLIYVINTNTGKLLWTTYYSKTAEDYRKVLHFGRPFTMTKLAKNMINDILFAWNEKHLGGCL